YEALDFIMDLFIKEVNGMVLKTKLGDCEYDSKFSLSLISDEDRKRNLDWIPWGTCSINIDVDLEKSVAHERSGKTDLDEISYDLCFQMTNRIYDYCIAFNIAYPGIFEFSDAEIKVNKQTMHLEDCISNVLLDAYLQSLEDKWPNIQALTISKVWEWINTKTNFLSGFSNCSIERALNAFTYLFNTNNYEDLLYCLMGIEAILNSGDYSITKQIKEKCELLFGKNFKTKSIGNMYDIRSRFIHGQLDFPSKFTIYDLNLGYTKFLVDKYDVCRTTAVSILLSLIQHFIKNDSNKLVTKTEISFE
ncbi:MAG: hypothetical protein AAGU14_12145, partial [Eubacteriaceae bacterium]